MQACALNEYQDNETQEKFVACVMDANAPDTAGEDVSKTIFLMNFQGHTIS